MLLKILFQFWVTGIISVLVIHGKIKIHSLFCVVLLDLGLISIEGNLLHVIVVHGNFGLFDYRQPSPFLYSPDTCNYLGVSKRNQQIAEKIDFCLHAPTPEIAPIICNVKSYHCWKTEREKKKNWGKYGGASILGSESHGNIGNTLRQKVVGSDHTSSIGTKCLGGHCCIE